MDHKLSLLSVIGILIILGTATFSQILDPSFAQTSTGVVLPTGQWEIHKNGYIGTLTIDSVGADGVVTGRLEVPPDPPNTINGFYNETTGNLTFYRIINQQDPFSSNETYVGFVFRDGSPFAGTPDRMAGYFCIACEFIGLSPPAGQQGNQEQNTWGWYAILKSTSTQGTANTPPSSQRPGGGTVTAPTPTPSTPTPTNPTPQPGGGFFCLTLREGTSVFTRCNPTSELCEQNEEGIREYIRQGTIRPPDGIVSECQRFDTPPPGADCIDPITQNRIPCPGGEGGRAEENFLPPGWRVGQSSGEGISVRMISITPNHYEGPCPPPPYQFRGEITDSIGGRDITYYFIGSQGQTELRTIHFDEPGTQQVSGSFQTRQDASYSSFFMLKTSEPVELRSNAIEYRQICPDSEGPTAPPPGSEGPTAPPPGSEGPTAPPPGSEGPTAPPPGGGDSSSGGDPTVDPTPPETIEGSGGSGGTDGSSSGGDPTVDPTPPETIEGNAAAEEEG